MNKVYARINWQNEPSIQTPLNEVNLNKIDYAVDEIDNRVISLDTTKANESDALLMLKDVTYDPTTGVFTFTKKNGTQIIADLNIEKIPVSFSMSEAGVITMTTTDGTTYTADVSKLIKTYSFEDTDTINMSVETDADGNKTITAEVIDGSITEDKLQPNYLADITTQANKSKESADSSLASANASADSSKLSESWAVGGTNTREGEDTNNAKYWSEQAKSIVGHEWDGIQNKPFTSIGDNLTVDEDGRLNAEASGGKAEWGYITGDIEEQTDLAEALDSKADKEQLSNRNILDNPFFTINSKGQTSYSTDGDTFDKWKIYSGSISKANSQITLTKGTYLVQRLVRDSNLLGKTVTLSILMADGSVSSCALVVPTSNGTATKNDDTRKIFRYLELTSTNLNFVIRPYTSGTDIAIKGVKLELGEVSTILNDSDIDSGFTNKTLSEDKANNGSSAYVSTKSYAVGEHCIYNGRLWCCKVACSGQTPISGTYWKEINLATLNDTRTVTLYERSSVFTPKQEDGIYNSIAFTRKGNVVTVKVVLAGTFSTQGAEIVLGSVIPSGYTPMVGAQGIGAMSNMSAYCKMIFEGNGHIYMTVANKTATTYYYYTTLTYITNDD